MTWSYTLARPSPAVSGTVSPEAKLSEAYAEIKALREEIERLTIKNWDFQGAIDYAVHRELELKREIRTLTAALERTSQPPTDE